MEKIKVLLEITAMDRGALGRDTKTIMGMKRRGIKTRSALNDLGLKGFQSDERAAPTPMFTKDKTDLPDFETGQKRSLGTRGGRRRGISPDITPPASSHVIPGEIDKNDLMALRERPGVKVWPNTELSLLGNIEHKARSQKRLPSPTSGSPDPMSLSVDCDNFTDPVETRLIRDLLGLDTIWPETKGQGVSVAVLDTGIHGQTYPVEGGSKIGGLQEPGEGALEGHGSMCAAGILMVAPKAKLLDYPFIGTPFSGGALEAFHEVLIERMFTGQPHITSNSYGYFIGPDDADDPLHEFNDIDHPLNRKILEVVADGCVTIFAAGNCGGDCPQDQCSAAGQGPGKSIHGPNSLPGVITVGAVNSQHQRLGYSSQGPGGFQREKPDLCGYSHFFGHYGPGRPGGSLESPCDMGTSAAAPVVAGVAALMLSINPHLTPADVASILNSTAHGLGGGGWNRDTGHGVINALEAVESVKPGSGEIA